MKLKTFLAAILALLLIGGSSSAQTFGRNKVRYEPFRFFVLTSEHFQVYHYPRRSPQAEEATGLLERWYAWYSRILGYSIQGRQRVVLYNDLPDFRQTNVIPGLIPEGTGGVTESLANRMVIPLTGICAENDHVLGHELVHAFQFTRIQTASLQGSRNAVVPPLWMVEGMAEYLSRGRRDGLTAMWMRDAVLHDDIPTLDRLTRDPSYFPYRFGQAVWAYIAGTYGETAVPRLFDEAVARGVSRSLVAAFGIKPEELSRRWAQALRDAYAPDLEGRLPPAEAAAPITEPKVRLNLSPSVSPDGRSVVFFSRRNPFTLDLYLADTRTGKILRRLTRSERDEHFDALRFTDSAGSWSPDSSRFAFVVYRQGDNAVAVVDARRGRLQRTIRPKGVDAISDLAWSPDGRSIVLSGTRDAVNDLFLLDLERGTVEPLTGDSWVELQPAWSPDGKTLAFVTDRDIPEDASGRSTTATRIALMDLPGRQVRLLPTRPGARLINPQFAPDGRGLYAVADFDGFSDVYRYVPAAAAASAPGELFRVTRLATGVTGLTELAPCLSVARESGTVVFSAFDRRGIGLYRLEAAEAAGRPVEPQDLRVGDHDLLPAAGGTPPAAGRTPAVSGAPPRPPAPAGTFSDTPYRPGLSLIGVGQAGVTIGFSPFGPSLQAPVELLLGDVLGDQMVGIAAQLTNDVRSLGGRVSYFNQSRRLSWLAAAGHIPLSDFTLLEGLSGPTDTAIQRQITYVEQADLRIRYPLSVNRRLEAGAGYSHNTFLSTADRYFIENGLIVAQQQIRIDVPAPLDLFYADLAFVGDYSLFGFTSPLRGSRYRLEVQQVFGSLTYLTALADYRQYVFLRWLGLAFRGLYVGRYLGDAESSFLDPLSIGNPLLVRGYYPGSFGTQECGGDPTVGCPVFDRLFGSQMIVFNAELRLPLFGSEELGLIPFRAIPLDLVGFFDGGLAWTSTSHPVLELSRDSQARIPVFSAGVAARVNLMGAAVLEFYYAYPFQRPRGGWQFGILLSPGW